MQGKGVSKGLAMGKTFVLLPLELHSTHASQGLDVETTRFKTAQKKVIQNIEGLILKTRKEVGSSEAEIFEAHLMMVQDEELESSILQNIADENSSAESAIEKAFELQIQIFGSSESEYMRERVLDLQDLRNQFLESLSPSAQKGITKLSEPVILIAKDLTPSQTMSMDRKNIRGMVMEQGGETSHTAIIARTMGIPAIVGVENATQVFNRDQEIGINGSTGEILIIQDAKTRLNFTHQLAQHQGERLKNESFRGKQTFTQDQKMLKLYANIGNASDAQLAEQNDAEGIGLFRTELLFMERTQAPTQEEQLHVYQEVLTRFSTEEVIIRTIDIGGDKPIPYLNIEKEENPFLGVRAFRYCIQNLDLFKSQIKAMLLANTHGNLSILIPMISRASEAKQAAEIIHACNDELKSVQGYHAQKFKIGVMVEIPALVFEIKELIGVVDFLSVGTNDLLQYSLAVDRMNPDLHYLYSPYNLGFIRLMNHLGKEAAEAKIEIGICGELGSAPEFIPLWIAMGYSKLSMVSSEVIDRRALIHQWSMDQCKDLLKQVLLLKDETEVKQKLKSVLLGDKNK